MVAPCILVVEDDDAIRDALVELLESDGYTVHAATRGQEALADMRACPPCIVILDLMMPVLDGWGVLRAMREDPQLAGVPVCVVSAIADHVAPPVHCVLRKPIDTGRLREAIAHSCGHARAGALT